MPASLEIIFKQVRKEQIRNKLRFGIVYESNDLIYCDTDGSFVTPNAFTQRWRKAVTRFSDETNTPVFTHHAMRSILATFYKNAGFNDLIAAKSLGHSDSNVTREFYLRPIESELTKTTNLLDERVTSNIV